MNEDTNQCVSGRLQTDPVAQVNRLAVGAAILVDGQTTVVPHIKRKLAHARHSVRSRAPDTIAANLQGQTMGKFAACTQIAKAVIRQETVFSKAKRLEEGIVCFQTGNIEMKMADIGEIGNRSDRGQIADLCQFPFHIEWKRRTERAIRNTSRCKAGPCVELRAPPLRSFQSDLHT
ncbi:hypothetical protein ASD54_06935 [Rhizobium sp. Root149]|nr:hypothetical protein ASD54_06935 [Rhizobium sp. Root149]